MAVSVAELTGLVFLGVAGFLSVVSLGLCWKNEHRMAIFMAVLQATSIPVALIPQLIINGQEKENMEKTNTPFFLLAYPASILLELVIQWVVMRDDEFLRIRQINVVGMFVRLVLYVSWLGQYSHYGHHDVPMGILTGAFSIAIAVGIALFGYRSYVGISVTDPKGSSYRMFGSW
jgi:uncharacterized protein with PQ loop repeat